MKQAKAAASGLVGNHPAHRLGPWVTALTPSLRRAQLQTTAWAPRCPQTQPADQRARKQNIQDTLPQQL